MNALEAIIRDTITAHGPMRLDQFMDLALAHPDHGYYMKKIPFGREGDFITAPEISQLFGESIALYLVQKWQGRFPLDTRINLVELGPGRGTLMADMLRTIARIAPELYQNIDVFLCEISPTLKAEQIQTLSPFEKEITYISSLEMLDNGQPLFLVANEFFDALPIRQFRKKDGRTEERYLTFAGGAFTFEWIETPFENANTDFYEYAELSENIMHAIAQKIAQTRGIACIIDYGYLENTFYKDTLQAVQNHHFASPLHDIGNCDLTAHVDFHMLRETALKHHLGISFYGTQAAFLKDAGIEYLAGHLLHKNPDRKNKIEPALYRLTDHDKMGTLFKIMVCEK